ncbi:MAG: hypothetical protein CMF62_08735 [Magnetococcales bacterium]|nr:hypothetical protein [Magnetococcales bacterium]
MGIFDIFKGKHKDDVYHSGSREAQRHWAQYQKFQDAQNRVLGEPAGMMPHAQNINADAGLKYTQKNIKDPKTGDRDPNGTYKTRGFNQLANSIRAGEAASLAQENPKATDNLIDNLADMRRRLTNDFTRENYMARSHAIRAEFEARLPKAQAATAFDKYVEIMQDPEVSKRLASSEAVRKGSEAYQYGLSTIAAAKKLEDSTARHKETGNQLLEEELGLKPGALKGSILGDSSVMIESSQYFKKDYDRDIAPFRDGNRDSADFASGSHLMMVETTLDIVEGAEEVPTKHSDKTLNEYFTARQQEMARPEASSHTLDPTRDIQPER